MPACMQESVSPLGTALGGLLKGSAALQIVTELVMWLSPYVPCLTPGSYSRGWAMFQACS